MNSAGGSEQGNNGVAEAADHGEHHQDPKQQQRQPIQFAPGSDWTLWSQGAEARIWKIPQQSNKRDDQQQQQHFAICKERFSKKYRHPQLDEKLTKLRCRMEGRILAKCRKVGIRVPAVLQMDSNKSKHYKYPEPALLYLEFIDGSSVRDYLEQEVLRPQPAAAAAVASESTNSSNRDAILQDLATDMAGMVARLHNHGMVHGDLTTSNMIIAKKNNDDDNNSQKRELTLIDFGLSKNVQSAEERAVDLYVLERALQSTHPNLPESFWECFLQVYKKETTDKSHGESSNKKNNKQQDTLSRLDQVRQRGRKRECFG